MTREKAFKRVVRERMTQTGEPYTSSRMHVLKESTRTSVAITNGDSVAGTLRTAGLADVVIAWIDVLWDGPVPDLAPAALRKVRAAHLSARYGSRQSDVQRDLAQCDLALRRHARRKLTLWFEADLHDQLQLIQILSRLRQINPDANIQMVSVGEHPDRARFGGLGELSGDQLKALLPVARPVSASGMDLAREAWSAFTASDPSSLNAMRGVISSELRYLGDAISRLVQEYPSTSDGLALTQRRSLLSVRRGLSTLPQILRNHWQSETRPFVADLGLLAELRTLSEATTPALTESAGRYALTSFGQQLLDGGVDWVEVNGIERWIGGVHLSGRETKWRYDGRLETLVSTS